MMRLAMVAGSAVLASCFIKPDRPGGAPSDGSVDAASACAPGKQLTFGNLHEVTELASIGMQQYSPWLSRDKSELWFTSQGSDAILMHSTWNGSAWSAPNQVPISSSVDPHFVVTDDGLSGWFSNQQGDINIYMATRAHTTDPFVVQGIESVSTDGDGFSEDDPTIDGNATHLVFRRWTGGSQGVGDLMIAKRATPLDAWETPQALAQLNTGFDECCAALDETATTLYFASNWSGDYQIYVATRPNPDAAFGSASLVGHMNAAAGNDDPMLSRDGRTLMFASDNNLGPSSHLWQLDATCQ